MRPRIHPRLRGGGGDTGDQGGDPLRWELTPAADAACAALPSARLHAQVTSFVLETPIQVGVRELSRGALVYGGRDAGGGLQSDLWLFDLGASAADCPWIPVLGAGQPGGLASGAAVFDREAEAVWLAGGFAAGPGGERTSDAVWRLSLREPSLAWRPAAPIPQAYGVVAEEGSPECDAPWEAVCQRWNLAIGEEGCDLPWGLDYVCTERAPLLAPIFAEPDGTGLLGRCDPEAQGLGVDPFTGDTSYGFPACGKLGGTFVMYPGCAVDPGCVDTLPRSGAAPGRAEHALVWAGGAPVVLGGTSGCVGSGCEAWQAMFDADGLGQPRLRAVNAENVQPLSGSTSGAPPWGPLEPAPVDWPLDASAGWRAGAVVSVGRAWSPASRAWQGGAERFLLLGGSRAQEVSPGVQHQLTCGFWLPDCVASTCELPGQHAIRPRCASYVSDGFAPGEYPSNMPAGALVSEVRAWAPGGLATALPATHAEPPGRLSPAAARLLDDRVLWVGGADASGVPQPDLVQLAVGPTSYARSRVFVDDEALLGARVGAAAELDPVTGRVWIFGGHPTDNRALWLRPDGPLPPPGGQTLRLSELDLRFSVAGEAPASAEWLVSQTATLEVACEEAGCWSQNVDLVVLRPRDPANPPPTLWVDWDGMMSSTIVGRVLDEEGSDVTDPRYLVRYRLPRELVHGDRLRVQMQWVGAPERLVTVAEASVATGLNAAEFADDGSTTVQWRGAVFSPKGPANDWDGPRLDDLSEITAAVPEGWTAIAPGVSDHPGPAIDPFTLASFQTALQVPPADLRVWWVENLLPPVRREESGIPVYFYAHQRLASTTPAVMSFLQDDVGDDLLWLKQRFGPLARAPGPGVLPLNGMSVLVRPPSNPGGGLQEQAVGVTYAGLIDVHQGLPDGRVDVAQLRSTALHELAHGHFDLGFYADASWLNEGAATLAELVRFPELGGHKRLLEATVQEVNRRGALARPSSPVPPDARDFAGREDTFRRYSVGAYTLSQWSALRGGAPSAEPEVWALLRTARAGHAFNAVLDAAEVASLLDADEPGFSAAWTAADRPGLPLLGITALEHRADGRVLLRIEQVQTTLLGVPSFAAVPMHVACHPVGAAETLAWSGCTAHGSEVVAERRRLEAPSFEVLIPGSALTLPGRFALLQGASLLPEHEGTYGVIPEGWQPFDPSLIPPPLPTEPTPAWPPPTPTWLTRCKPEQVGVHPACRVDADGDLAPRGSDCDDKLARVRPDQPDPGEAWVDLNCDGWYAFPGVP